MKKFYYILLLFCSISYSLNAQISKPLGGRPAIDTTKTANKGNFGKFDFDKSDKKDNTDSTANEKNIYGFLGIENQQKKAIAWTMDKYTYDLVIAKAIDTSLYLNHLYIPGQDNLVTQTYLGNLGSPIETDDFFSRNHFAPFLFSRYYTPYLHETFSHKQYNVRTPLTRLYYENGGKRKSAEQILRVLHTQNVNRFFNVGIEYDYYNTKGIYDNQLTKNNAFSAFASYYRNKFSAQATFSYFYIRNQENGGVTNDSFIADTVLEPELVPFTLQNSSTEFRQRSFASVVSYDILSFNKKKILEDGKDTLITLPLLTAKYLFDASRFTRVYSDVDDTTSFYKNYYISDENTHDSVYRVDYTNTLLFEVPQIAKYPGIPGLRFWASNSAGNYWYFNQGDYIYDRKNKSLTTNNIGIGVYSHSDYLSYAGAARLYLSGYRSSDKEMRGSLLISPWKSTDLPYIKGEVILVDREPDIFIKNYFSNNFMWSNNFEKEKWLMMKGTFGADKINLSIGYNVAYISNYIYFNLEGVPAQASDLTVTSAYVKKTFRLGGLSITGKVLWQAYTNDNVISLPKFSGFGAIYYEYPLVKNVLTGQLGISAFYRTKFYADAYNPATGQYYQQRDKKIGNYPFVDIFANFRWKRTILFVKYEHANQGMPNNEFFTALHYPANQKVLKFGVSWMFYD